MTNLPTPKNILVVALSGIGNWLMQSPAIGILKQQFPDATITAWVAPRGTRILAEHNPHIAAVIEAPIKMSIGRHFALVSRLARQQFDAGIVLSPGQHWKSAAYLFLAGIPARIGNTYPFRGAEHSRFLLTHGIEEVLDAHDIEQNLRLLEPLGIKATDVAKLPYELAIPTNYQQAGSELLQSLNVPTNKKLIGFHMGCAPDLIWKRWPVENFIALGKELIARHQAHILLFGDESENDLKKQVEKELTSNATSINSDLLTTAAAIQHCQLFVANDSGLMHMAAAVGVPTFGLFGPTDEQLTGPRGKKSYVIRTPGTKPTYNTEKNFFIGNTTHATLQSLTSTLVHNRIVKEVFR